MPTGVPKNKQAVLPTNFKVQMINGKAFVAFKAVAKLAGIHPAVLEMGTNLLKEINMAGATFVLATPEMRLHKDSISYEIVEGLRKFAKAQDQRVRAKVTSYEDKLVFWYEESLSRKPNKAKAA